MDTHPSPPPEMQGTSPQMPPLPDAPTEGPGNGRRRFLIVIAIVVAAAIAIGAIAIRNLGSSGSSSDHTAPSPTEAPVPASVSGLRAKTAPFQVRLSWRAADGDVEVTGYTILRDGESIGSATSGATTFADEDALPTRRYVYAVQAVGADGGLSELARIQVRTPAAPLSDARLEGVFNVKLDVTSSSGVTGMEDSTAGWRFRPTCNDGPCDVDLRDIHWKAMATKLHRQGATYTGSVSVRGFLSCGGTQTTSSVKITLHVTKAALIRNAWRATRVEGTMSLYDSAQLGCRSASVSYRLTGALPGA